MSNFENIETDPAKPMVGSVLMDDDNVEYVVKEVRTIEVATVTQMMLDDEDPSKLGYDELFIKRHSSGKIVWLAYTNKK